MRTHNIAVGGGDLEHFANVAHRLFSIKTMPAIWKYIRTHPTVSKLTSASTTANNIQVIIQKYFEFRVQ